MKQDLAMSICAACSLTLHLQILPAIVHAPCNYLYLVAFKIFAKLKWLTSCS
jgi:hypothetical protein